MLSLAEAQGKIQEEARQLFFEGLLLFCIDSMHFYEAKKKKSATFRQDERVEAEYHLHFAESTP